MRTDIPFYTYIYSGGYFCKREDGSDFAATVWPGRTHFPDVLNTEARQWFGSKYKVLTDAGIDGFWNDMNEPAIFYSDEGMDDLQAFLKDFAAMDPEEIPQFLLNDKVNGIKTAPEIMPPFTMIWTASKSAMTKSTIFTDIT